MTPMLHISLVSLCTISSIGGALPPESGRTQGHLPLVGCISQTVAAESAGDAMDDAAIWVHPSSPDQSLIIGTDKKLGLHVYDLDGRLLQTLPDGRMNNVDVLARVGCNAPDGQSRTHDLVFATNRTDDSVFVYAIDSMERRLTRLDAARIETRLTEVYGVCAYQEPATGGCRVVVTTKSGLVRIFALDTSATIGDPWTWTVAREFHVGSQIEGVVADTRHGRLFVGEEGVGVWMYPLEAASAEPRRLLDTVDPRLGGHLAPDVEGISLYAVEDGSGCIVVSCQSQDRYAVYDRISLEYLGSFGLTLDMSKPGSDRVTHTDGIEICSQPLGARFPAGAMVAQDDNGGSGQNFKLASWEAISAALARRRDPSELMP